MMMDIENDKYNIIRLEEIDSTNEYAKRIAKTGAKHGTIVLARKQSAGKGRLGRGFESNEDKGIFMSMILRPDIEPIAAARLTLVAAAAVRQAIKQVCSLECDIKWPNDIVADGRKVCGILTEMSTENGNIKYVIVGIGINVTNELFKEELSQVATSILMLTGKIYDREVLMWKIINQFDRYYEAYVRLGNLTAIKDDYDKYLVNIDRQVRVVDCTGGRAVLEGICRGIDEEGNLLIETESEDGSRRVEKIVSGEVSVRGVYGYV